MADADLDVVIRKLAKLQTAQLMAAVRSRKAHYNGLAAKAKTPDAKDKFRHLAKEADLLGSAAAKRLQISADNAADSYARSMRLAAEAVPAKKPIKKAKA